MKTIYSYAILALTLARFPLQAMDKIAEANIISSDAVYLARHSKVELEKPGISESDKQRIKNDIEMLHSIFLHTVFAPQVNDHTKNDMPEKNKQRFFCVIQ